MSAPLTFFFALEAEISSTVSDVPTRLNTLSSPVRDKRSVANKPKSPSKKCRRYEISPAAKSTSLPSEGCPSCYLPILSQTHLLRRNPAGRPVYPASVGRPVRQQLWIN